MSNKEKFPREFVSKFVDNLLTGRSELNIAFHSTFLRIPMEYLNSDDKIVLEVFKLLSIATEVLRIDVIDTRGFQFKNQHMASLSGLSEFMVGKILRDLPGKIKRCQKDKVFLNNEWIEFSRCDEFGNPVAKNITGKASFFKFDWINPHGKRGKQSSSIIIGTSDENNTTENQEVSADAQKEKNNVEISQDSAVEQTNGKHKAAEQDSEQHEINDALSIPASMWFEDLENDRLRKWSNFKKILGSGGNGYGENLLKQKMNYSLTEIVKVVDYHIYTKKHNKEKALHPGWLNQCFDKIEENGIHWYQGITSKRDEVLNYIAGLKKFHAKIRDVIKINYIICDFNLDSPGKPPEHHYSDFSDVSELINCLRDRSENLENNLLIHLETLNEIIYTQIKSREKFSGTSAAVLMQWIRFSIVNNHSNIL